MKLLRLIVACLCLVWSTAMAAGPAAMVYGTDAVPTPPAVTLPQPNDYWFTNGNGTSVLGTQVPDYWVNKVGGELDSLINGLGGTLSMTNRAQILGLLVPGFSFAQPGYYIFPGGFIVQWGTGTLTPTQNLVTVNLARGFPNAMLFGVMTDRAGFAYQYGISMNTLSSVNVFCPTQQLQNGSIVTRTVTATGSFVVGGY